MTEHDTKSASPAPAAPEAESKSGAVGAVNAALTNRGSGEAHGDAAFHNDATSHAAAGALGAKAFTAGSDVFFGSGQLAPGTASGDKLISEEMGHVEQMRGVAGPEAGNFRVSSPDEGTEQAARTGAASAGSGAANTIYRDTNGTTTAPAAGGTGPAATGPGSGGAGTAPAPAADPYEEWKTAVNTYERAGATSKWTALAADKKQKITTEAGDFLRRVIFVMKKDSPDVLKTANAKVDDYVHAIFLSDEFAQFLPTMRTAGLLTPFLSASPTKGLVTPDYGTKLKGWIDTATNATEARAIFQKVYPNAHDTATPALAFGATPVMWTVAHLQRLYGILNHSLPIGHAQTITGGFVIQSSQGFGWWEPSNYRVALPAHGGSTSAAGDLSGHDMTGGTGSGANSNYTKKDGTAGGQTSLGHYEGTVLHEVGHGVGERMGGNAYALNSASYPGFTPLSADAWGNELWTAPTGTGDNSVSKAAKLDDATAKRMMLHEIQNGAGTFTFDPGWFKSPPSNGDMRKWVESRYANVPLQKWWKHLAIDAADKGGSYSWNVADARTRGDWTYAYLTRYSDSAPHIKMKTTAYTNKVSWYSVSSPLEWFAEQYTHYYRTEKTGGGLIDSATKDLLDKLDKQQFVPSNAVAGGGFTMGPDGQSQPASQQGRQQQGQPNGTGANGGGAVLTEPLFFPW
jgi:hypothetical protein